MLTAGGTIGVLANTLNAKTAESKSILRLFITNLPTEYQDMVPSLLLPHPQKLKDFLVDVILKCVDQPVPQPPITSLIAYKDQGYAMVEFATPELATACLALDGLPYEGISIGVVRPPTFNPADVPMPSGRPPRLQLDKIGFTPKLGARAIADAMAQGDSDANCKVFVGEIPAGVDEEQIKPIFASFGEVKSITISRDPQTNESRGFGYVVYASPEVVPLVCKTINGIKVCDQSIVVRPVAVKQQKPVPVMQGEEMVKLDPAIIEQATMDLPNLKVPFLEESDKARETAAKLLKQAGINTGGQIQKSPPSRILVLKNMVTKEDLENPEDYLDIKADIETECSRFGQVLSVAIPRGESPGVGNVIVEYPNIQQAASAAVSLIGRRFNKRIVRATFMSEASYANKQYNVFRV